MIKYSNVRKTLANVSSTPCFRALKFKKVGLRIEYVCEENPLKPPRLDIFDENISRV